MRIALLGGTGSIGEGLALRWAFDTNHEVLVGSRDPERARAKAEEYETELDSRGVDCAVKGFANEMATDRADVVVLAVPPYHVRSTLRAVADRLDEDAVVVNPAVGMARDDDGNYRRDPPSSTRSLTELVAETAPGDVSVVGAYHTVPAARLANLDAELGIDVPVVADDDDAKETVAMLTEAIDGLRALDAGDLSAAGEVEGLTPLVLTLAANNEGLHDLGVTFH
ncbi:MAG: NADPH-dependent F420 reductase [Halobacteriaceae archaeon]